MSRAENNGTELLGIYNIMGEGLVVELLVDNTPLLYDRRGLQHRIISRQKAGEDTLVEERALAQINSYGAITPFSEIPDISR